MTGLLAELSDEVAPMEVNVEIFVWYSMQYDTYQRTHSYNSG